MAMWALTGDQTPAKNKSATASNDRFGLLIHPAGAAHEIRAAPISVPYIRLNELSNNSAMRSLPSFERSHA